MCLAFLHKSIFFRYFLIITIPLTLMFFFRTHAEIAVVVYLTSLTLDILFTKFVIHKTVYVEKNPAIVFLYKNVSHPIIIYTTLYAAITLIMIFFMGIAEPMLLIGGIHLTGFVLNIITYLSSFDQKI